MGVCSSCESTSIVVATAKVILHDGKLQEFSCPVKVSHVLQNINPKNPNFFVCNSDDMEFDDFISAINGDEDLLPGHLYFALPRSWLKHPLRAQDIASLVAKASSALKMMKSGSGGGGGGGGVRCGGCCQKGVDPIMFLDTTQGVKSLRVVAVGGGADGERLLKSVASGGDRGPRGGKFSSKLCAVIEE